MASPENAMKQLWEASFEEQITRQAYNTAPVEALVRIISYYLRDRFSNEQLQKLHFMEMGCGAGSNLVWLAQKGIRVSGVDISPTALRLARRNLKRAGCGEKIGELIEASVTNLHFKDEMFDGIIEACVFQHLTKEQREKTFGEVRRLLKRGGVFAGYMLDVGCSVFKLKEAQQLEHDPGTLVLNSGNSRIYLTNIGVAHFFRREEIIDFFKDFSMIDPCLTTYYLPREEAEKRGYEEYLQSMWSVYAVK